MPIERRDFIKSTTAAITVGAATLALKPHSVLGANDRVRVAICGTRGRGVDHIHGFNKVSNVEIAALCDVDENVLNQRLSDVEKLGRPKPKAYTDVRKLLEDKEIDAVSIATPNHWHSLIAIWTVQAGKDVYVEKPCSHNTFEGRQLVAAVKKYNRICQHGSQWRSNPGLIEAMGHLKDGTIGDVYIARAGLGVGFPVQVSAIGGHFMFDDDQETLNTLNAAYIFEADGKRKMMEIEVRHWITNHEAEIGTGAYGSSSVPPAGLAAAAKKPAEKKSASSAQAASLGPKDAVTNTMGNIFYGSKGYLGVDGYDAYKTWVGEDVEPGPHGKASGDHYANFVDCVRSRDASKIHSPIDEAHKSTTLVHLANVSYRLGRTLKFDPTTEKVIADEEANVMLRGTYRAPYVV